MKKTFGKISIPIVFDRPPGDELALVGFLFNCNGKLIQRQFVRNNLLEFSFPEKDKIVAELPDLKEMRLFIAPAFDKKILKADSIEEIENVKPYEPILQSDLQGNISILPVPENISRFWLFCKCRITGKISKWFHIGNTWKNRAVCKAKVHICEIDAIRYWIYKIPDTIIAKIPEAILNPKEIIKQPIPIPDPLTNTIVRDNQPTSSENLYKKFSAEEKQLEVAAKLPELSIDIRQNLASQNLNVIRETIVSNYSLLHPWFCLWPWWWPYFYRCQELAVVYTDANGRFDTNVWYRCFGDKPDIYIWVEYFIDGAWTTVYRPPIPCYTYWNYTCSTDINITVTDQRVPGDCCCDCGLPGEFVWIRTIGGSGTSVAHINQQNTFAPPPPQSVNYNRIGLTDAAAAGDPSYLSTSIGDYKRPFGSTLAFYMGFGNDLPNTGIYYYRWRYKKVADAGLSAVSGTTQMLNDVVNKTYDFIYIDSNGDQQIGYNSVKMGPFTVGANDDLFIIPPDKPNKAPFSVTETLPDWVERTRNMATVIIDSNNLKNGAVNGGDGLYEFTLELFDKAGNLLTNIPKATFKTPKYDDQNLSENAPDELLSNATATTADAYKMLIRIDNSACNADIFTVNVNGSPASTDCCGFVKYKPGGVEADLELSFLATHPNNFAVFSFDVAKGTCGAVSGTNASGMVIDSASGYSLSSGVYSKHFTPNDLLSTCYNNGTGKAAFAESLEVAAMATNGVSRVIGKDAEDLAAFALEP